MTNTSTARDSVKQFLEDAKASGIRVSKVLQKRYRDIYEEPEIKKEGQENKKRKVVRAPRKKSLWDIYRSGVRSQWEESKFLYNYVKTDKKFMTFAAESWKDEEDGFVKFMKDPKNKKILENGIEKKHDNKTIYLAYQKAHLHHIRKGFYMTSVDKEENIKEKIRTVPVFGKKEVEMTVNTFPLRKIIQSCKIEEIFEDDEYDFIEEKEIILSSDRHGLICSADNKNEKEISEINYTSEVEKMYNEFVNSFSTKMICA